jgi:hypothetical protein
MENAITPELQESNKEAGTGAIKIASPTQNVQSGTVSEEPHPPQFTL